MIDPLLWLLTVQDTFALSSGLLLVPDFPAPSGWKNLSTEVDLQRPDGSSIRVPAQIRLMHLRVTASDAPLSARWRLCVSLEGVSKEQVPKRTNVFAHASIIDCIAQAGGEGNDPYA